jgi:hypothetical protein
MIGSVSGGSTGEVVYAVRGTATDRPVAADCHNSSGTGRQWCDESWIEAIRLESACRLLETTNRSIEQIAGFGTPETTHRTFRRRLTRPRATIAIISVGASSRRIPELCSW